MKPKITLIAIANVKRHERISDMRVIRLVKKIKTDGGILQPIIVDRKSRVVLDGHHRLAALRLLGAHRVPVRLVDYENSRIRVYLRKKYLTMNVIKKAVLYCGMAGVMFPIKTTRHVVPNMPVSRKTSLKKLVKGGEYHEIEHITKD